MDTENDNLEIGKYLDALRQWWWVVLLVPIAVAAAAYYQADRQTPVYQAQEQILVQQERSGLIGSAIAGANDALADIYARLATTDRLLAQVQIELDLDSKPKVEASGKGAILQISAESPDPVVAKNVASALTELLILDIQTSKLFEIARLERLAESQGIGVEFEVLRVQVSLIDSLRVIEPAVVPANPFSPRPKRNAVLGAATGLILGVLLAFALEIYNKKLRSIDQLTELLDDSYSKVLTLGVILRWKGKEFKDAGLAVREQPNSIYAEMYRTLRSGFQYARLTGALEHDKAFLVTSAIPTEGKTTVSANLAIVLAQAGLSVILVDGDLRRPSLDRVFNVAENGGSGDRLGLAGLILDGTEKISSQLLDVGVPGLKVLTSSPSGIAMNPADLLSSLSARRVFEQLRQECDIVLVDSPPINAVVDPLILAGYVDAVILTVSIGAVRHSDIRNSFLQLKKTGTPMLGIVLNKVKTRRFGYGQYYHQSYYSYASSDKRRVQTVHEAIEPSAITAFAKAKDRISKRVSAAQSTLALDLYMLTLLAAGVAASVWSVL